MQVSRITSFAAILLIAVLAVAACAPAPTPAPTPAPPTAAPATLAPTAVPPTAAPAATATTAAPVGKNAVVDVASNAAQGKFIVDGAGMTLYMFVPDKKSDSTCYDNCAKSWPPLLTDTGKVDAKSSDLSASMFGSSKRKDGTTQVTFNGWPLYYFANDKKAGDVNGQGSEFFGPWWVMAPNGSITVAPVTLQYTFNFGPGKDATQEGTVRLRPTPDGKTSVTIALKGSTPGVVQPAHIHEGTCPNVGAVKFPLTNVTDGASTTTVDAKFADLFTGGYAINVHKSTAEGGVYVACVSIPQGAVVTMDKGRDGDLHGTALVMAQGAKTEVDLFLTPNIGLVQPAHIHEGACPGVGAVKYPLTNIEEGHSKTVVDAAFADLFKGGYAINSHLSTAEAGKYVACGNLASAAK